VDITALTSRQQRVAAERNHDGAIMAQPADHMRMIARMQPEEYAIVRVRERAILRQFIAAAMLVAGSV
jgi:hypothetical protein